MEAKQPTDAPHAENENKRGKNTRKKTPYCASCNTSFPTQGVLKLHYREFHAVKVLTCGICKKTFPNERQLSGHIQKAHEATIETCKDCGLQLSSKKGLNRHRLAAHREKVVYHCDKCNDTFTTKGNMEIHRRMHTGEIVPTCHICNRMFPTNGELDNCIQSHSNIEQYKCDYCDKHFTTKRRKYAHVTKSHTAKKKYACHTCGKGFIDSWKLRKHEETHEKQKAKSMIKEAKKGPALTKAPHKAKKRAVTATVTKPGKNPVVLVPNNFPTPKPNEIVLVKKQGDRTFQVVNLQNNVTSAYPQNQQVYTNHLARVCQTSVSSSTLPTYTIQNQSVNSQFMPAVQPQSDPGLEMEAVSPGFLTAERTNPNPKTCKITTISEKQTQLKMAGESLGATVPTGLPVEKELKGRKRKLQPSLDNSLTNNEKIVKCEDSIRGEPEEEPATQRRPEKDDKEGLGSLRTDMAALPFETDVSEQNPISGDNIQVKAQKIEEAESQNKTMGPLFFCSQCQKEFLTINELILHEESHLLPLQRLHLPLPGTMKHPTTQVVQGVQPGVPRMVLMIQPQVSNAQRSEATNDTLSHSVGYERQQTTLESIHGNGQTANVMACPSCRLLFPGMQALENHLKVSSGCIPKTPHGALLTGSEMLKHKEADRSDEQNNKCDNQHNGEEPIYCKICWETFPSLSILSLHLKVHSVKGNDLLAQKPVRNLDKYGHPCLMCEKVLLTQQDLMQHLEQHYEKIWLSCQNCEKVLYGLTEMREHQKSCGRTDGLTEMRGPQKPCGRTDSDQTEKKQGKRNSASKCSICGKTYSNNEDVEAHIYYHGKVHALTCPTCGQCFDRAGLLSIHMELMNHMAPEIFWCEVCRQVIHDIGGLELHMKQHENREVKEPTETCEVCGGHFDDLKAHILEEHKVPTEITETHTCTTCGDRFDTSGMLEIHKQIMKHETPEQFLTEGYPPIKTESDPPVKTEDESSSDTDLPTTIVGEPKSEEPKSEDPKSISCSECDNVFKDSGALRLHMTDHHSNDLKLTCKVCSKSVIDLKAHMLTHKKDNMPFKCEVCGKGFLHKSRMDFHMRMHAS